MLNKSVIAPFFLCIINMWKGNSEGIQSHKYVRFMLSLCSLDVYSEKRWLLNSKLILMPPQDRYSKILTMEFCCLFLLSLTLFTVVISLLINLGSPVSEVRRAALNCFRSLSGVKDSLFHPIFQHLVQKTEEIISDPAYITQVFVLLRCALIQVLLAAVSCDVR